MAQLTSHQWLLSATTARSTNVSKCVLNVPYIQNTFADKKKQKFNQGETHLHCIGLLYSFRNR